MDSYQVLPLWATVDLGVIVMKGYSGFPNTPALLEPHHQIISRSLVAGEVLLLCSRCILQPLPTGRNGWYTIKPNQIQCLSTLTRHTSDWPIYISTISSHVNSTSTFHFNTYNYWLEICVRTKSRCRYILLHNTLDSCISGGIPFSRVLVRRWT